MAKKRVQCLNEVLCFVSSSVLADSLVLRNPLLRQAPKRYEVKQQVNIKIEYDSLELESTLRIDLLVNDTIIIELKTVENILPIHEAQLLTYMKLLEKPQGLLINFYTTNITKTLKPFVNEYFSKLED